MDREAVKIQRRSARHGGSAAVKVNRRASLTAQNDPASCVPDRFAKA
jgi:hypothetical protein